MARGKKNNLFKHGGHSLAKRYKEGTLDRRTKMGKHIEAVKKSIIEDVGSEVGAPQKILLELILQKIIVTSAIADYCKGQGGNIISNRGEILPCLSKNYLAYSNSLIRDLKVFYELAGRNQISASDAHAAALMQYDDRVQK